MYANTVNDVAGGCEVGLVSGMLCFQVQLTMLNTFARSARVRKYTFTENANLTLVPHVLQKTKAINDCLSKQYL